jgi:hypothetical protein
MKMYKILLLFSIALLLSGCELPSSKPNVEEVLSYTEAHAEVIGASSKIDNELTNKIQATLGDEGEGFLANVLINDIRHAKTVQLGLLKAVMANKAPSEMEEVRDVYVAILTSRVYSYDGYVQVLEKNDPALLASALSKHQLKDPNMINKSLIELNHILETLELKTRDAITPPEEDEEE